MPSPVWEGSNSKSLFGMQLSNLRLYLLIFHSLFTTFLFWTKQDCIQVTIEPYENADVLYPQYDYEYTVLVSFGLLFLIFRFVTFCILPQRLSFLNVVTLLLDILACFFLVWIILDGLSWYSYTYIFVFCTVIPLLFDIITYARITASQNVWISWRKTYSLWVRTYYFFYNCYASYMKKDEVKIV